MAETVTLGSIANLKTGPFGTQFSASEYSATGTPIINVKSIGHGVVLRDDLDYVPDSVRDRLAAHTLVEGDIVFARKGSVDRHAYVSADEAGWIQGSDCIRVQCKHGVNSRFISHWLKLDAVKEQVNNSAVGSTMASLNTDILAGIHVRLPDPETQNAVAAFLSRVEDQVALNTQVNDNLQAMLQTLYGYWFLQFDFPDENGRPYRASGGRMVWNDQLKREIPAGWRAVTLRELLKKNRKAFDYGTVEPTIDLSVMPTGSIALNNLSRSDAFSSNLYQMSEGDILFGAIRPYLKKAGIAPCNGVVAGTVHSFSPVRVDDYNFALATITSEQMFSHAVRSSTGTRMPTVKADDLLDVVVAYSESVATAFNQIPVARSIIERVQESSRLGELRDWLLPMLMNGQATVASSDKLSFT